MNWRFSTSAMVFVTPNSLAVRQVRMLLSLESDMAMKASVSEMPASRSTSVSRASALMMRASGHRSDSLMQVSRSGSMILNLNLSPAMRQSCMAMRLPPMTMTSRIERLTLPHSSTSTSTCSRVVMK